MLLDWLPTAIETKDPEAQRYLRLAYRYAAKHATDPQTKNGSVIVYGRKEIFGANRFPEGVQETPERWERPEKYDWVEHAERDAIYKVAQNGNIAAVQCNGAVMYCTWYACIDCARAIICSGLRRVVGHKQMFDRTPDRWRANIQKAFGMLDEAGISCELYNGTIGEVTALFAGEVWQP
jgi:dCMP deaminase